MGFGTAYYRYLADNRHFTAKLNFSARRFTFTVLRVKRIHRRLRFIGIRRTVRIDRRGRRNAPIKTAIAMKYRGRLRGRPPQTALSVVLNRERGPAGGFSDRARAADYSATSRNLFLRNIKDTPTHTHTHTPTARPPRPPKKSNPSE